MPLFRRSSSIAAALFLAVSGHQASAHAKTVYRDSSDCEPGVLLCGDPHMQGLRGQHIDWFGVDGGWYSLIKDDDADLHVIVRLTAPLPEEFPDRQLITGFSVLSEGHSLAIEVKNPYDINTDGCPRGVSPCLANGGLSAVVDEQEASDVLHSSRNEYVADGIAVSASNVPAQCRQFCCRADGSWKPRKATKTGHKRSAQWRRLTGARSSSPSTTLRVCSPSMPSSRS